MGSKPRKWSASNTCSLAHIMAENYERFCDKKTKRTSELEKFFKEMAELLATAIGYTTLLSI